MNVCNYNSRTRSNFAERAAPLHARSSPHRDRIRACVHRTVRLRARLQWRTDASRPYSGVRGTPSAVSTRPPKRAGVTAANIIPESSVGSELRKLHHPRVTVTKPPVGGLKRFPLPPPPRLHSRDENRVRQRVPARFQSARAATIPCATGIVTRCAQPYVKKWRKKHRVTTKNRRRVVLLRL